MSKTLPKPKEKILFLTREYSMLAHAAQRPGTDISPKLFVPWETLVTYAEQVFTNDEVEEADFSQLVFWLT
jgi:hypothetical protein